MYIHLHKRQGMFTLVSYNKDTITIKTKQGEPETYPVSEFKCIAGGRSNFNLSNAERRMFLSVVAPEQLTTENIINETALKLGAIIDMKEQLETYQNWYEACNQELNRVNAEKRNHATRLYEDLAELPILKNIEILDGLKFIIQEAIPDIEMPKYEYRFCFDPYRLMANYHSDISYVYTSDQYCTINGGWIKIFDQNIDGEIVSTVVLYGKSGDYGVYDDEIAIATARIIFPDKHIESYAGKSWDEIEKYSDPKYGDILPF